MSNSISCYLYHPANSMQNSHGIRGGALELAFKDFFGMPLAISGEKSFDVILLVNGQRRHAEVKQNGGGLGNKDKSGNSLFIYCPVVRDDLPIDQQEMFVLPRKVFIEILHKTGNYRSDKDKGDGTTQNAVYSIWNYKRNKPCSNKKYLALLDELYTYGELFSDWVKNNDVRKG